MPDDIRKTPPESPTGLEDGLRGRVTGVTRIGPRAFGIGFIVIFGLLLAILYGVNHQSTVRTAPPIAAVAPAAAPSDAHFGASIPEVPSQIPATEPPPILTNPVPDVANSTTSKSTPAPAAAPAGPSPEELRERAEEAAREQALADAEAKRRALLLAARKSPILTGSGANQLGGVGSTTPGQPVQVGFAGNGAGSSVDGVPASYQAPAGGGGESSGGGFAGNGTAGAAAAGATGAVGAGGGGAAGGSSLGSGGGTTGNALLGQQVAQATGNTTVATNGGGSFMNGPFGQYNIPGAGINIPRGGTASDFLQSSRFGYISPFELVASSVIPAELVSSLNSDLPGLVTGLIREDVYDSKTGKYLLIPRGSRLIGEYNNTVNFGQSRVSVAWRRLIFPDTTSINLLQMPATDVEGSSGLAGTVDNHYGKIIGAALLTSVLAAGLAVASPQQQNVLLTPTASQEATASIQQNVTNLGTQLIQRDLSIPPTLMIPKGYPFLVLVDRDIVFPGPYTPR